jgi:hypothetical protein
MPPYLAGRVTEQDEFRKLLAQTTILRNMILTGLRGVGKTVLLQTLKPIAQDDGWLWVGADMTETTSIKEDNVAIRLATDLSVLTSSLVIQENDIPTVGFHRRPRTAVSNPYSGPDSGSDRITLNYQTLIQIYEQTPGLVSDKLKGLLRMVWSAMAPEDVRGVVFAYDEAQNLSDHATKEQYPLSLLLDVFQSIQREGIPFMLVLTGLPTLFAKLVNARTYSERMFHVVELAKLEKAESRDAILVPIQSEGCPVKLNDTSVDLVTETAGGYPYFIQFICREVYDLFIQKIGAGKEPLVPIDEIVQKPDADFFAGRWSKATDRQRELLSVIATLDNCELEFTPLEVVESSKAQLSRGFSQSHATQMLGALCKAGLVFKNRHGKYCFAVPLLHRFIKRQEG